MSRPLLLTLGISILIQFGAQSVCFAAETQGTMPQATQSQPEVIPTTPIELQPVTPNSPNPAFTPAQQTQWNLQQERWQQNQQHWQQQLDQRLLQQNQQQQREIQQQQEFILRSHQ